MGRTKLIALLEEQHTRQWCLENLISLSLSSSPLSQSWSQSLQLPSHPGKEQIEKQEVTFG